MSVKTTEAFSGTLQFLQTEIDNANTDQREIQNQILLQMLQAAENIGKQKQSLEDNMRLLRSEGNKLRHEIGQVKLFYEEERKTFLANIQLKINAIYQQTLEIAKSYESEVIDDQAFETKLYQIRSSFSALDPNKYIEEGKLQQKKWFTGYMYTHFSYLAKLIQQASNSLTLDETDNATALLTDTKAMISSVSSSSNSNTLVAYKVNDYLELSAKILDSLQIQHSQLQKENEALSLQKNALKEQSRVLKIKILNEVIPKLMRPILARVHELRKSMEEHEDVYKINIHKVSDWHDGYYLQGYEMAKVTRDNLDKILTKLELISKE